MGDKLEVSKDMDTYTRRVPLGVVAAICPYVFLSSLLAGVEVLRRRSLVNSVTDSTRCSLRRLHSFNFPAMIPLWAMAMATVTGNSLILKPSERDPGAAMILAELAERAGQFSLFLQSSFLHGVLTTFTTRA